MFPLRVVASVLLAAVALVGAGPLAAEAAPRPPVAPSAAPPLSGILGAVSGLTSALPPVHVAVGRGPGAIDVTVDGGATVRRILGTSPSAPPPSSLAGRPGTGPSSAAPTPRATTPRRPHAKQQHTDAPGRQVSHPPAVRHAAALGTHHQPTGSTHGIAPAASIDRPAITPSGAVQALMHLSLGSDRTMLMILGGTALGALAALGTVVAMGRRPGLHRALVR